MFRQASPATYEIHNFDNIAIGKNRLGILRLGHNFQVSFYRDTHSIIPRLGKVLRNRLARSLYTLSVDSYHVKKYSKRMNPAQAK